jgi:hypothetical protein
MKRSTAERGSKLPDRKAAELLQELLPALNAKLSQMRVRRQTLVAHPCACINNSLNHKDAAFSYTISNTSICSRDVTEI